MSISNYLILAPAAGAASRAREIRRAGSVYDSVYDSVYIADSIQGSNSEYGWMVVAGEGPLQLS